MKKRIIWIDWAKALGIMIVVFCHIPQDYSTIKYFLSSFQMPLFFMLSGYLHNQSQTTILEQIKKYWKSLVIPYILFQFIFYPYWLIQQHTQEGLILTDWVQSIIIPFVQCIYGIPIDGVTWFIFALLITKLITDIIQKTYLSTYMVVLLCSFSIILAWIVCQDDKINITFAIDSLFNFFPFFFIGYYLKMYKLVKEESQGKCLIKACVFLVISIIFIYFKNENYFFQRISFYALGLSGSFFVINISKMLKYCPKIIQTVSIGNIIILGLHWMFIGTTNFVLERIFSIEKGIHYTIIEATILTLFITMGNCIIIKFCQKHFKPLLGYR